MGDELWYSGTPVEPLPATVPVPREVLETLRGDLMKAAWLLPLTYSLAGSIEDFDTDREKVGFCVRRALDALAPYLTEDR